MIIRYFSPIVAGLKKTNIDVVYSKSIKDEIDLLSEYKLFVLFEDSTSSNVEEFISYCILKDLKYLIVSHTEEDDECFIKNNRCKISFIRKILSNLENKNGKSLKFYWLMMFIWKYIFLKMMIEYSFDGKFFSPKCSRRNRNSYNDRDWFDINRCSDARNWWFWVCWVFENIDKTNIYSVIFYNRYLW